MYDANPAKCLDYVDRTINCSSKSPKVEATAFDPMSTKKQRHLGLCRELNELYCQKNQDYGDSFHKTFVEEGFAVARIKLGDKLERFKTLSKGAEQLVKDESMRDTLIDLANYALMTILEMEDLTDGPITISSSRTLMQEAENALTLAKMLRDDFANGE